MRAVAALVVAVLAVFSAERPGVTVGGGSHACCDTQVAVMPCGRTPGRVPCCIAAVPMPAPVTAGQAKVAAPRVTLLWGLEAERPPDSAAPVEAAAAYVRWLAGTPPPPYLLNRVLRI